MPNAGVRVAVVGYGYWGPNLARCLAEAEGCEVAAVADPDGARLALAARRYPGAALAPSLAGALEATPFDAVAVATPLGTHHAVAREALDAGLHVLVAKPLAARVVEAEELSLHAARRGLALLVDHTFLYSPAVQAMRDLIGEGAIGAVLYADSVRANLGLFRRDASVLWDLAAHDLAILLYLIGREPEWVSAVGADPVGYGQTSVAYLTLGWRGGPLAGVHVNWLSPVKVRRMLVGGSERMIVYDDVEPTEKVRIYDAGVDVDPAAARVDYRTGDVRIPKLPFVEPLAAEVADFLACVRTGRRPVSGGPEGVAVVRLLEAAGRSMGSFGERVSP